MVRLGSVAFLFLALPAVAWGAPPENSQLSRTFQFPQSPDHQRYAKPEPVGRAEIGPNAHFGFGMYGLKSEKTHLQPVIGREIIAPKQRRAAVGFSLKF